ncbi:hypothetical protein SeLEV6574_g00696 [Synchytrium endobioticum]|uniref:Uncharacterized protein n=1 Tax=Synchytrium endobioticum TaxID=286115 RepID=A0A507DIR2_9FUNG|nr:hypothetical protein SeLEV6574_g00696 [Synchytrium endobioticum]
MPPKYKGERLKIPEVGGWPGMRITTGPPPPPDRTFNPNDEYNDFTQDDYFDAGSNAPSSSSSRPSSSMRTATQKPLHNSPLRNSTTRNTYVTTTQPMKIKEDGTPVFNLRKRSDVNKNVTSGLPPPAVSSFLSRVTTGNNPSNIPANNQIDADVSRNISSSSSHNANNTGNQNARIPHINGTSSTRSTVDSGTDELEGWDEDDVETTYTPMSKGNGGGLKTGREDFAADQGLQTRMAITGLNASKSNATITATHDLTTTANAAFSEWGKKVQTWMDSNRWWSPPYDKGYPLPPWMKDNANSNSDNTPSTSPIKPSSMPGSPRTKSSSIRLKIHRRGVEFIVIIPPEHRHDPFGTFSAQCSARGLTEDEKMKAWEKFKLKLDNYN